MDIKELTVGIEEEYQVIDPETGELTSYIAEFLERDAMLVKDSMVPEFPKSQLEVTSQVCKNIKEARSEVIRLRQLASNYAKENNCKIIGPVIIGEDCILENNCIIGPNVSIGNNCKIANSQVENSIIMDNCIIDSEIFIEKLCLKKAILQKI